jgi:hypothetical protein
MDAVLGVIVWLLLVHLVARRGYKTGLFYPRVFFLALVPFLFPFVLVWVFWRNKRSYEGELRRFYKAVSQDAMNRTMTDLNKDREQDK